MFRKSQIRKKHLAPSQFMPHILFVGSTNRPRNKEMPMSIDLSFITSTKLVSAIRESVQCNRIVEVSELSDEALDELVAEADDYADENDGSLDVWGATEDGHEWRVRVIR